MVSRPDTRTPLPWVVPGEHFPSPLRSEFMESFKMYSISRPGGGCNDYLFTRSAGWCPTMVGDLTCTVSVWSSPMGCRVDGNITRKEAANILRTALRSGHQVVRVTD